jgi:hypothetical protein
LLGYYNYLFVTAPTSIGYHKSESKTLWEMAEIDKEWGRNNDTRKSEVGKSAYAISKELGVAKNIAKKYINQPVTEHGLKGV